jgi:Ca2+:H+ antiporter
MTPAFVGVVIVALVGGAAEMVSAFSAAGKNRLDLSVGIALGSAAQIGRSTWFGGALMLAVYISFAMTLYLFPPRV